ncbi:MAG: hypothetical protein IPO02_15690 [Bacteroidetes bacterium]|nr:hypothetical protein [Bacteroidota bacterium]
MAHTIFRIYRPVKAELNFEGVGAYRAQFTNGLVFHETVSEYVANKKMVSFHKKPILMKYHQPPWTNM